MFNSRVIDFTSGWEWKWKVLHKLNEFWKLKLFRDSYLSILLNCSDRELVLNQKKSIFCVYELWNACIKIVKKIDYFYLKSKRFFNQIIHYGIKKLPTPTLFWKNTEQSKIWNNCWNKWWINIPSNYHGFWLPSPDDSHTMSTSCEQHQGLFCSTLP